MPFPINKQQNSPTPRETDWKKALIDLMLALASLINEGTNLTRQMINERNLPDQSRRNPRTGMWDDNF